MNPKISILLLTYNHEAYLGQCIESLLRQTYANFEIFIIDDASPDRTPEIVRSYKDPRITYLPFEHQGIYQAAFRWNEALRRSTGEWIALIDGDDYWPEDKLERQVPLTNLPDVALLYGRFRRYDQITGTLLPEWPLRTEVRTDEPFDASEKILYGCWVPALTVLIRKSALEKIGGFQQPPRAIGCDYPTWLALSRVGRFVQMDRLLGYWRIHGANTSSVFAEKGTENQWELVQEYLGRYYAGNRRLAAVVRRQWDRVFSALIANKWHGARRLAADKRWPQARREFVLGLRLETPFRGSPRDLMRRAACLAGWLLAWLHLAF